LQRHGIDDGGQHAHIISLNTIHSAFRRLKTAENIASTDDYRHLYTHTGYGFYVGSILRKTLIVNSELLVTHQCFTGEFEEDTFVFHGDSKIEENWD